VLPSEELSLPLTSFGEFSNLSSDRRRRGRTKEGREEGERGRRVQTVGISLFEISLFVFGDESSSLLPAAHIRSAGRTAELFPLELSSSSFSASRI